MKTTVYSVPEFLHLIKEDKCNKVNKVNKVNKINRDKYIFKVKNIIGDKYIKINKNINVNQNKNTDMVNVYMTCCLILGYSILGGKIILSLVI